MSCRITPLSSYDLPCHTPFQTIALPAFQSEVTLVPNMYCLTAAGVTSASQTLVLGALIEIAALAMRFMVSILAPPERRINRQPFDDPIASIAAPGRQASFRRFNHLALVSISKPLVRRVERERETP